jgi:UDP-4-amino-4,6-dideoxy-N-acetyl-beta-L-altrosamine transaminase
VIPYGRQDVTEADVEAAVAVLRSEFLTQGPAVPRFERAVAECVGAKHAVAVNSATSALHIACIALGLGPGDHLWTSPNTFVASAHCALYCGANVDFVDIDPLTWNLSVACLEEKLADAEKAGRLPKIVVPVHFAGQPTDQEKIWKLAQRYGFKVLEDASHSIGAARDGVPVGGCRWSDVTVFSFHPVKIITTGEGGMALTNDAAAAARMEMLRTHGITRAPDGFRRSPEGAWYYEQQQLGFNYRMTDIQAAIGLSQLRRLAQYVDRRNFLASQYDAALQGLATLPSISPRSRSSFHLYVIRLPIRFAGEPHRQIFDELRRRGVGVNLHYMPVHLQPFYRDRGFLDGQFPQAELHGRTSITLPLYPRMSDEDLATVVTAVRQTLGARN